jgi:tRNA(fMet)-specific endonuclease VapC
MLDTNTCIYVMKQAPLAVKRRFDEFAPGSLAISALVVAELWHGVAKSEFRRRNKTALQEFLANLQILDWPSEAAPIYGEIRAALERAGRLIGGMDMLIAAHALHERAGLVTRNLAEFRRVPGLRVENWVKG